MKVRTIGRMGRGCQDCRIALVLPGGGARGAYQVGVLKAIGEILPPRAPNPFAILSGTSAGAISAAVIASRARRFAAGVADLERVWANFHCHQVFRSDALTMLRSSLHWFATLVTGGLGRRNPRSLLDNSPLRELLEENIGFDAIQQAIDRGYLEALAVTCAGYGSARSVSFYQSAPGMEHWDRVRRRGRPTRITLDHLMASIAVPMIFPAVRIGREYFGDGAMRQATPLSPALHLGADRILVIGVRNEAPEPLPAADEPLDHPTFGNIAGYMLDALFMDGLSADLENLTRLNLILESAGQDGRMDGDFGQLRSVETCIQLPSQDIREIAQRHVDAMPRPVRLLLRGVGSMDYGGRQLLSYLQFEGDYTRELIELGYRDGLARRELLESFLRGEPVEGHAGIVGWDQLSEEYTARLPKPSMPL
ncbi:MAG: patatin-like phospholipase family protein [Chromatiales bacterium]|nr:patatin-like phospholipase family protein [Chromatiales bacterium]